MSQSSPFTKEDRKSAEASLLNQYPDGIPGAICFSDDKWDDGKSMGLRLLGVLAEEPKVSFNLPGGHRIVCDLFHFNQKFPEIWNEQADWRNKHNEYKRSKINT